MGSVHRGLPGFIPGLGGVIPRYSGLFRFDKEEKLAKTCLKPGLNREEDLTRVIPGYFWLFRVYESLALPYSL